MMMVISYLRYINIHILLTFSLISPKMAELWQFLRSIRCISLVLKLGYCVFIYMYELIEETARRNLIFGMWEFFGYGSTKF